MGEIGDGEAVRLRRSTGRPKPDLLRVRMVWALRGTGTGTAVGGNGRDRSWAAVGEGEEGMESEEVAGGLVKRGGFGGTEEPGESEE